MTGIAAERAAASAWAPPRPRARCLGTARRPLPDSPWRVVRRSFSLLSGNGLRIGQPRTTSRRNSSLAHPARQSPGPPVRRARPAPGRARAGRAVRNSGRRTARATSTTPWTAGGVTSGWHRSRVPTSRRPRHPRDPRARDATAGWGGEL